MNLATFALKNDGPKNPAKIQINWHKIYLLANHQRELQIRRKIIGKARHDVIVMSQA